jgi:TPR repeat protein
VPQDYVRAREWYEKAAAKNDAVAMSFLGLLYANGQGVPQNYAEALEWYEKAATTIEASEIEASGKPGPETAGALGSVAWHALFARRPDRALATAERALSLTPGQLWIETNRAHALMFLGRAAEARALYLAGMDKPVPNVGNKPWQQVIADDFAELRQAGLDHPLMAEIEAAFKNAR